jgi:hypothetical protein
MSTSIIADFILYLHFFYVLGVLIPIPLIVVGAIKDWLWIRNFWFRRVHAFMILFVVFEAVIGMTCPLTDWETALRGEGGPLSPYREAFIRGWVSRLLFYELEPWVFTVLYMLVAVVILLLYIKVPPYRKDGGTNGLSNGTVKNFY